MLQKISPTGIAKYRSFWLNSLCIQHSWNDDGASLVDRLMEKQIKLITFRLRNDKTNKTSLSQKNAVEKKKRSAARSGTMMNGRGSWLRRPITWETRERCTFFSPPSWSRRQTKTWTFSFHYLFPSSSSDVSCVRLRLVIIKLNERVTKK